MQHTDSRCTVLVVAVTVAVVVVIVVVMGSLCYTETRVGTWYSGRGAWASGRSDAACSNR
jgi:hypothetical protein